MSVGPYQCRNNKSAFVRMAGSKLLARLLLLISSVTLISLLALTRCGLGGLAGDKSTASAASTPQPDGELELSWFE